MNEQQELIRRKDAEKLSDDADKALAALGRKLTPESAFIIVSKLQKISLTLNGLYGRDRKAFDRLHKTLRNLSACGGAIYTTEVLFAQLDVSRSVYSFKNRAAGISADRQWLIFCTPSEMEQLRKKSEEIVRTAGVFCDAVEKMFKDDSDDSGRND